jgi:hypothetical protein
MKNFVVWALLISSLTVSASSMAQTSGRSTLSGRITVDGNPFSEAVVTVYLLNKAQSGYDKSISSRTSGNGLYRFEALTSGSYVLVVTKGSQRLYQGKIAADGQQNLVHNIDLTAFLFAGNWKLNSRKSKIPASYEIVDETRTYSKKGDLVTAQWNRTFKNGKTATGKYEFKCDGKKWVTGEQTISCVYEYTGSGAVVEGEMSPPRVYFRNEVKNGELAISTFEDNQHNKLISLSVFDPNN